MMSFLKFLFSLGFGFSISIRTPNENIDKLDNEYIIWCKWNKNRASFMWETENGKNYYGRDILIQKEMKYKKIFYSSIGMKDYVKSAKEINLQEIFTIKGIKGKNWKMGVGITETWENFNNSKLCGKGVVEYNGLVNLELNYVTNFNDRKIFEIRIDKEIGIKSWLGFGSFIIFRQEYGKKRFFQFKSEVNFKLNELMNLFKK